MKKKINKTNSQNIYILPLDKLLNLWYNIIKGVDTMVKFKTNTGKYKVISKEEFMRHVARWKKIRKANEQMKIIEQMERED